MVIINTTTSSLLSLTLKYSTNPCQLFYINLLKKNFKNFRALITQVFEVSLSIIIS